MLPQAFEVKIPDEDLDLLFCIYDRNAYAYHGETELYTYGVSLVCHMDFDVYFAGAFIRDIECVYATNCIEMDMHLEDPEEMGIKCDTFAQFYPPENTLENYCGSFQIAYTEKEMVIVLSDYCAITHYVRNGRVDFYYTENDELEYVRVRDLTRDEYEVLKSSSGRY